MRSRINSEETKMALPGGYPVQIQADNVDAADGQVQCMCHVFDVHGLITVRDALQKQYLHVVAWDVDGNQVSLYDNR